MILHQKNNIWGAPSPISLDIYLSVFQQSDIKRISVQQVRTREPHTDLLIIIMWLRLSTTVTYLYVFRFKLKFDIYSLHSRQ